MPIRSVSLFLASLAVVLIATPVSAQEPVLPGDLIKGSGPAVYYYYGNRYAFPNEDVYYSWYAGFSEVKTVSDAFLASVPLVGNVRFKPGTKMVKITTDPKVYFIDNGNELRWIPSEAIAAEMHGADWATQVRDVSDALFIDYRIGEPIAVDAGTAFRDAVRLSFRDMGEALRRMHPSEPAPFESFVRHPSITEASKRTPYGYTASTTEPMESVKAFYVSQSSDWDLLYEDLVETSFGNGYLLNFGQTREGRFAHRSVAVSVTSSTDPRTTVEFLEAEYPEGFIAYPHMAMAEYVTVPRLLFQHGLTKDRLTDIVLWYKELASTRGWELVSESEAGSLEGFASVRRLFFLQPGTHIWLQVEVTQVGESFRDLTGDLSSVVVEYLH